MMNFTLIQKKKLYIGKCDVIFRYTFKKNENKCQVKTCLEM